MNIKRINKKKVLFWILLLGGVGCCVGGIFVPALLVPGAGLIAAAGAVHAAIGAMPGSPPIRIRDPVRPITKPEDIEVIIPEGLDQDVDIELHVGHQLSFKRTPNPVKNNQQGDTEHPRTDNLSDINKVLH